jgi:hypothetical protein
MKKFLLMFVITGSFLVASVFASDQAQSIRENVFLGMHQIKLPDGLTAFGESAAVMGDPFCDVKLSPLDDDHSVSTFIELGDFARRLKNPTHAANSGWFPFASLKHDYYSPKEILDIYRNLANKASHLNLNALMFFETILRTGQISGMIIPGLEPQPERAALFQELYEWRSGARQDAKHALEAIRIERERLEAIAAEEEAKGKAEAAEEAARIAAIAAAENAKLEMDRKSSETSGVRRRHVPRTQNTGDDDRATVKDPLISRHPTSHY